MLSFYNEKQRSSKRLQIVFEDSKYYLLCAIIMLVNLFLKKFGDLHRQIRKKGKCYVHGWSLLILVKKGTSFVL